MSSECQRQYQRDAEFG